MNGIPQPPMSSLCCYSESMLVTSSHKVAFLEVVTSMSNFDNPDEEDTKLAPLASSLSLDKLS